MDILDNLGQPTCPGNIGYSFFPWNRNMLISPANGKVDLVKPF